jgi:hypothetical protein
MGIFVDLLVILISISTLAVRWITFNLAGSTIRFLQKVRNYSENSCDLLGINTSNFMNQLVNGDVHMTIWNQLYVRKIKLRLLK